MPTQPNSGTISYTRLIKAREPSHIFGVSTYENHIKGSSLPAESSTQECRHLAVIQFIRSNDGIISHRIQLFELVIVADEKSTSFHQYLRYSHKHGTIAFSTPSAIIWAYSHIASMVELRFSLFEQLKNK